MSALYTLNNEKNGIEISFQEKPGADTLTALKGAGFRWHRVKMVWYAKQTADRIALAESITSGVKAPTSPVKAAETINLDNLATTKLDSYYNVNIAAAIRQDLKSRGVKGATVRASRGYSSITVTVKAAPEDFSSIEEYSLRYTFNEFSCDAMNHGVYIGSRWLYANEYETMSDDERRNAYIERIKYVLNKPDGFSIYNTDRRYYPAFTTAFYNKLVAIFRIANQWNYNNSDPYTDYYDIGYYLDIEIKVPAHDIRETMSDDERTAYEAEKAAEKAEEERRYNEYLKEQEEREKAHKAYEEARQAARKLIADNIITYDLDDAARLYITNLAGGIGKEATIDELKETIAEKDREPREALITRKVIFKTHEAYNAFCGLFLDDFDFLAGKGGTATEDVRLEGIENPFILNTDQRESIKWFMNECVAIYDMGRLALVSNPEGYSYSRYTYIVTDESEVLSAAPVLEEQKKESEEKPVFYFPAPIEDQIKAIQPGQDITIYQCDGWILNSIYGGAGTVLSARPGSYAQYNGFYIDLLQGKKQKSVFIRDGKTCLIYEGIKGVLPDEVTRKKISDNMYELFNYEDLFPAVLSYYAGKGEKPILDTYQR